ncbi:MAG: Conjugative transfer protein TrbG [uncultured Sulfurovum sp.]|uniref:Conjugative transfer protein TrbG n=1 Tax=uncultured Sulfurovum sp. TaxID=269237 RepID=A0A6S6TNQ8_9BACT|nr:MAG: Conjugative transfer protein TrbG [uncultured Sulfurovum sp.]
MKKYVISVVLLLTAQLQADEILSDNSRELSQREWHSVSLSKEWLNNGNKSFRGTDGSVSFLFGATMPRVVVAPLKITDIQFQKGEKIMDVQLGDTTRWMTSPSISGEGNNQVSHLLLKTTDVGLETTLFVSTNRRTYHMNLFSRKHEYMPIVAFKYKDEINKKWENYNNHFEKQAQRQKASTQLQVSPKISKNIDNLDFDYRIIGDASWKPTRVYNDGIKTYIQMPKSMIYNEAPIFLVLDQNDNNQLVNYRLTENNYIVDKLFNQGILIIGVGDDQEKIRIERKSASRSNIISIWEDDNEEY